MNPDRTVRKIFILVHAFQIHKYISYPAVFGLRGLIELHDQGSQEMN